MTEQELQEVERKVDKYLSVLEAAETEVAVISRKVENARTKLSDLFEELAKEVAR